MDRAPRRRALIGMVPLALAATYSAVTGALAGVEAARREDRWRRALVRMDLVSAAEALLAPARDLIPPDAVVGVTGALHNRPGDGERFVVLRCALAPRRLRAGAVDAPFVVALGEAAPIATGLTPVMRLGPGVTILRREG